MKILIVIISILIVYFFLRNKTSKSKHARLLSGIKKRTKHDDSNPYLWFNGVLNDNTPKDFIPLLDTIRPKNEWITLLGRKIKSDCNGNYKPFTIKGYYYGFTTIVWPDKKELEAISSGKKYITDPGNVSNYIVNYGCTFDDFIELDENVKLYCIALQNLKIKKYHEALIAIQKAVQFKPDDNLCNDLWFDIRLQMGDLYSIEDAVKYYANDMDSMVHSGKTKIWIKALLSAKEYKKTSNLIIDINRLLDDAISGKRKKTRYSGQQTDFIKYKKEEFNKKLVDATGFTNINKIVENHSPIDDFLSFCKLILNQGTSKKRIFAERMGDVYSKWGKSDIALDFFNIALNFASREQNAKIQERLNNKINKID